MKLVKKVLPAAILLGLAGAAQAQVSVYGLIDVNYSKNEFVGEEKAKLHSGGDGGGNGGDHGNSTTRFGIKGSTDVGSGIKANFNLQSAGIDANGGQGDSAYLFGRQAWLGFSGSFGEVRLGRQDSVPFQAMGEYDFNGQSNGVTSAYSGVGVWATGRQSRSIQYMSPTMSGFSAHVGLQVNGKDDPEVGNFNGSGQVSDGVPYTQKDAPSIAVKYAQGDLSVGAAYEGKRTSIGEDFASVAASYDFKVVKVMAGYTDAGNSASGPTVGIVAPVAGFTVGAHYAKNTEADKDAVLEVFVNKEIFKNTYAYVEAARRSSDYKIAIDRDLDGTVELSEGAKDGDTSAAIGVIYVF